MKKVVGILLIILIVLMQINVTLAASKSELEEDQKKIDSQINQKEDELEEIQEQKSETLKEVENLISQISEYEAEINELQDKIDALQEQIDVATESIKEKEAQYAKEKQLLDDRLLAICEAGETRYLDVLLASDGLVDFISKYNVITELVESDTELLKSIENQKKSIEDEKTKLENDKKELDTAQASKEEKYNQLKTAKSQKNTYVSKLTAEEKEIQKELEQFEKDKQEIANELKRIAEQEKNTVTSIVGKPSSSGYIFPVAGLSKANINNKTYPSYTGHTGVDVNINVIGKSVVAVKDGTVVTSKAISGSIKNYDSNGNYIGSYSSYGEYVVINHHDGTMTLYAHMKPGSRTVSVGQTVKQGQVIGIVGNTGNCQPRPTAANPLRGTHLHFEVRINGSPVNPLPYLP